MPPIVSTSGRLHSEFVRLLFLQAHRETDRFFAASGVHLAQSTSDQFHFRRAAFAQQLKSRVDLALTKTAALRIHLNLDGAPIASKSHTHHSHSQTSPLLTSCLSYLSFRCSSSTTNPVYERCVSLLVLVCSISSHRHWSPLSCELSCRPRPSTVQLPRQTYFIYRHSQAFIRLLRAIWNYLIRENRERFNHILEQLDLRTPMTSQVHTFYLETYMKTPRDCLLGNLLGNLQPALVISSLVLTMIDSPYLCGRLCFVKV
jgi:hypothetical protein